MYQTNQTVHTLQIKKEAAQGKETILPQTRNKRPEKTSTQEEQKKMKGVTLEILKLLSFKKQKS